MTYTLPSCPHIATTSGHQSILTPGDIKAAEAQVDDCMFRMLEPMEVAAGMAFPADYIWGGTRRERVKLCGNAVTPPAARDLVAAVAESLS
jgi:DNA (cytosine-5)-methyltransferase 1